MNATIEQMKEQDRTGVKNLAALKIRQAKEFADHGKTTGARDSALICIADAESLFSRGEYTYAYYRAKAGLAHTVGVFHPAYQFDV